MISLKESLSTNKATRFLINNMTPGTIGIFDSGIGGLTVANAIKNHLPEQKLLYIGDTAHCPWGDKSKSQIINYCNKLSKFLINNNCKTIVIACNTASCIALNYIQKKFKHIRLFDIVAPTIEFLTEINLDHFENIGIIGTKQTVNSKIYQHNIELLQAQFSINSKIPVKTLATPLLAPLIEENWLNDQATNLIIEKYLSKLNLKNNSILILACTHYSLIKKNIEKYYKKINKKIFIIDPSLLLAKKIKEACFTNQNTSANLHKKLYNTHNQINNSSFYFTEKSESSQKIAKRFFPKVNLEFLPLWQQGEILV